MMPTPLEVYVADRFVHQLNWYKSRASEYRAAAAAGSHMQEGLLTIAGIAGAVGFFTSGPATGIVAATAAALAAVIEGWMALMGFERNAATFEATAARLEALPKPTHDEPLGWAMQVEEILLGEVDQWARHWIDEIRSVTEKT